MIRKALLTVVGLIVLVAIGLAIWEPLTATTFAAPPEHRYDSVIARDRYGVPHIFGKTDPDVTYGVAYAHAEDDFATLQEAVAMARAARRDDRGGRRENRLCACSARRARNRAPRL